MAPKTAGKQQHCPMCGTPGVVLYLDGPRLRKARLAAGITVTALAAEVGVSVVHLADVERGRRDCRIGSPLAAKIRAAYPDGAV